MQFYMPTKVFEEKDCVKNHAQEIVSLGTKALIVTGRHSSRVNGSLDDVLNVLKQGKIESVIFDEVEENPSIETVMKARDIGIENDVDFVIGLGGGSAMDASKAIALMIYHKDQEASYLYTKNVDGTTVPMIAIPTTCGTGSEVTPVSVLTIHAQKTKGSIPHKIFAKYAFIDGKYLKFAPKHVLHNTAVDALAHLWESYINAKATDYSRMCVHEGMVVWAKSKDVLLGKKEATDEDYANMMRASAFAGMAIAQTGTSLPHGLSYPMTYDLHMPHGQAVGYFLGGYLSKADEKDTNYLLQTSGFESLREWQEFYKQVCGADKISKEELDHAVEVIWNNPAKLANSPFQVEHQTLVDIAYYD